MLKLGHPGIIIDERLPLPLLLSMFLSEMIVLGNLSTSACSHVQQIWFWSSSTSDVFPNVGHGADGLRDVCSEGGANASLMLMCKHYASLLLHPRLSELAWRIGARKTSKSSFSWSVLLSDMHSCSKMRAGVCLSIHPTWACMSHHRCPRTGSGLLYVVYLQTAKWNSTHTRTRTRTVTGDICGDVCEDGNSPHICMFVYTCNQQFSLFPFHALQPGFCRRWSLHTYVTLEGLLPSK